MLQKSVTNKQLKFNIPNMGHHKLKGYIKKRSHLFGDADYPPLMFFLGGPGCKQFIYVVEFISHLVFNFQGPSFFTPRVLRHDLRGKCGQPSATTLHDVQGLQNVRLFPGCDVIYFSQRQPPSCTQRTPENFKQTF